VLLLEELTLAGLGWLAINGPIRFTYRVRRARRALGALERGDFAVRLPTRALDDLGFLAVSFNATAEALGDAIGRMEREVAERRRAEEALRAGEIKLRVAERMASATAERMRAVAQAAGAVLAADSPAALRAVMYEACQRVIEFDVFTLGVYDPVANALRFPDEGRGAERLISIAGRPSELVVRERRSVMTLRADDPRAAGSLTVESPRRPESAIRSPIMAGGEVLGVLTVQSHTPNAYNSADVEIVETLAALAATALRNIGLVDELRQSQQALSHQAFHDALTGLPNRVRFRERVARALAEARAEQVAVLVLDLDGFKTVNDSLGHAAGDRLLVSVAGRLLNATRGCDTVARLGGDEFAVLLAHVRDDADAIVVANRILQALAAPFALGDAMTVIGTSIGIARARGRELVAGLLDAAVAGAPGDAEGDAPREAVPDEVDALLRGADIAMYQAKMRGKGQFAIFEPAMHEAAMERLILEAELRGAVANHELHLEYQPIVTLESNAVVGLEALLRWTHPRRGLVPPAEFIPLAEETGLIVALGRWVLAEACAQGARWQSWQREHAPDQAPITMAVNVSGHQLRDPGFVADVRTVLLESGLERGTLVLELTESTVVGHPEEIRDRLAALRMAGVQIAIDDFGTGYSALSYLQHFPIDVLKIDKAFVDGVTRGGSQGVLARTILALGEALSLRTIAEGIEEDEQRVCLRAMGCSFGQGYHFARPLRTDAVDRLVQGSVGVEV
jgi:diguanylate cyclase (GGDEF)-like protein